MINEISLVAKCLPTLIAPEGLLAGMNSQVDRQSRFRFEALVTLRARVGSLTCMDTSMDFQIVGGEEAFLALIAKMSPRASVKAHVIVQGLLP